jgi:hypothetical protein
MASASGAAASLFLVPRGCGPQERHLLLGLHGEDRRARLVAIAAALAVVVMSLRRTTRVISLQCPACLRWVKPRRWDKTTGLCWSCVSTSDRPTLFDLAFDDLPNLPRAGRARLTRKDG